VSEAEQYAKIWSKPKVTLEDMEQAIKDLEAQGYRDVKVESCMFWKGTKK
jgi:hypothetical protein